MSISLKYTELGLTKKGEKLILEENQYNYQEDTWTMIKQFMIVPTTAPAYNNYQLKKALQTAGIDVMISIYKAQFKRGISNMKASSIPLDKRRNLIATAIMKQVIISENKNHAKHIMDLWFAKKLHPVKATEWLNDFMIGEEIIVSMNIKPYMKGIISKINKSSVTIRLYAFIEIEDQNAITNQTYGTVKMVWQNYTNESIIVFDRGRIIKQGAFTWYDSLFIEGERSVDYGY